MSANVAASAAGLGLVRDVRRPSSGDPPARDRWFESIFLQRRVHVSRDFALPRQEAGFSRGVCGPGRCSAVSREQAGLGGINGS